MTEAQAQEVAAMGEDILPLVYDALFSRNEFENDRCGRYALRVLAHHGHKGSIPNIKEFLNSENSRYSRFDALRAILEIDNSNETREYTISSVNSWISHKHSKYRHEVEFGLLRLLDADIPQKGLVALFNDINLSKFVFRAQIIRGLVRRADVVSIAILKNLISEKEAPVTYLVAESIDQALGWPRDPVQIWPYLDDTYEAFTTKVALKRTTHGIQLARAATDKRRIAAHEKLRENFDVIAFYEQAAELGDHRAIYELGAHHLVGYLVKKDIKRAAQFFERASKKRDNYGAFAIGLCYLNGVGVPKDPQKGFEIIKKVAESGYREGYYQLGLCYRDGVGTHKNTDKALVWLTKGANFPHAGSKIALQALKNELREK